MNIPNFAINILSTLALSWGIYLLIIKKINLPMVMRVVFVLIACIINVLGGAILYLLHFAIFSYQGWPDDMEIISWQFSIMGFG